MNPVYISLVVALAIAQVALPKKFAFLPLVFAACHMGSIEVLPELTIARILILLGLSRAVAGGFFTWPGNSALDRAFYAFSVFLLLSSLGHKADEYIPAPFLARCGLVLNAFGAYLYGRSYLSGVASFRTYAVFLPFLLLPLAGLMAVQKSTERNLYSVVGIAMESSMVREDKIRANGPFKHPILAGCAGSTALPLAILLWYTGRRKTALLASATCFVITVCSASSGPLAAVAVSVVALFLWKWRAYLPRFLWGGLALGVLYVILKGRGPWYLMASLDLVGGSTGWHRAKLMDQGWVYLNEWWLLGTDYTRHWMSSGTRWNPNMVDLTNYYLHLGVTGGLAVMLSLMAIIAIGFKMLYDRMKTLRKIGDPDERILWLAGASLGAHALSFVAISYFDQMYIFFFILVGAIPGLTSDNLKQTRMEAVNLPLPKSVAPSRGQILARGHAGQRPLHYS